MKLNIIVSSLAALASFSSNSQVVTNLETGLSIEVETISENRSKITNLDTFESIEVHGLFETMTDAQYTTLIRGKPKKISTGTFVDNRSAGFKTTSNNVNREFSFKRAEFEMPESYISSGTLGASCSFTMGNDYATNEISVTTSLYKQVSWWADTKIGSEEARISYSTTTHNYNWSDLTDGYYYLTISKWINFDYLWVWGDCDLSF